MTEKKTSEKLGKCVICGKRVKTSDLYLTTSEGYTHRCCISRATGIKT